MTKKHCVYTQTGIDGYGTNWVTACGRFVRVEAPIEVGFCPAPMPNEDGKFCHYCGLEIELKEKP